MRIIRTLLVLSIVGVAISGCASKAPGPAEASPRTPSNPCLGDQASEVRKLVVTAEEQRVDPDKVPDIRFRFYPAKEHEILPTPLRICAHVTAVTQGGAPNAQISRMERDFAVSDWSPNGHDVVLDGKLLQPDEYYSIAAQIVINATGIDYTESASIRYRGP